jgi:hypothetical protein
MPSEKAIQPGHTKRYLPEKAWASLSKEERAKTDAKKKLVVNKENSLYLTQKQQRKQARKLGLLRKSNLEYQSPSQMERIWLLTLGVRTWGFCYNLLSYLPRPLVYW